MVDMGPVGDYLTTGFTGYRDRISRPTLDLNTTCPFCRTWALHFLAGWEVVEFSTYPDPVKGVVCVTRRCVSCQQTWPEGNNPHARLPNGARALQSIEEANALADEYRRRLRRTTKEDI